MDTVNTRVDVLATVTSSSRTPSPKRKDTAAVRTETDFCQEDRKSSHKDNSCQSATIHGNSERNSREQFTVDCGECGLEIMTGRIPIMQMIIVKDDLKVILYSHDYT